MNRTDDARTGTAGGPGVPSTDRTRFRLAMAKTMMGDHAGAKADFAQITTPNRKAIAEYWLLHIDHAGKAPAPAPAAT